MRHAIFSLVLSLLIVPTGALAQDLPIRHCLSCDIRQVTAPFPAKGLPQFASLWQVAKTGDTLGSAALQQQQPGQRSWAGRHPVLLGALIGMGGFAAIAAGNYDPRSNTDLTRGQSVAFSGAAGAGLGALGGLIVSISLR
jgi:hypothetical protein